MPRRWPVAISRRLKTKFSVRIVSQVSSIPRGWEAEVCETGGSIVDVGRGRRKYAGRRMRTKEIPNGSGIESRNADTSEAALVKRRRSPERTRVDAGLRIKTRIVWLFSGGASSIGVERVTTGKGRSETHQSHVSSECCTSTRETSLQPASVAFQTLPLWEIFG